MSPGASAPVPDVPPSVPRVPLDPEGRYRSRAPIDPGVVGLYGFLLIVLVLLGREPTTGPIPDPLLLVALLVAIYLARYVSTNYRMDSETLHAGRLFGSRTIPLGEIHKIEIANLRALSPTGFFRGWGWRGRMWSPSIGSFDSIHTVSAGVLVHAGDVPLFVSPRAPPAFVAELARRARSYRGDVEVTGEAVPPSEEVRRTGEDRR